MLIMAIILRTLITCCRDPAVGKESGQLSVLQGKEIIEYYLRELEEQGVTYIPRWTPPVSKTAIAIPVKGAKNGRDNKETEPVVGTPDGRC